MIAIPRGTRKVTKEMMETMQRLRRKGYSCEAIARHMKLCRSTVHNYLTGKIQPYTDEELRLMDGDIY